MGLLSFTNDTATGLDATLESSGRTLLLRTYSRGAVESATMPVSFVAGRWHSLAIVLERRTLLADRACVWLDGCVCDDGGGSGALALKYPSVKGLAGGLAHCSLGGASPGRAALAGQLAGFSVFSAAATAREVEGLHCATRGAHACVEPALLGPTSSAAAAAALLPARLCAGRKSGLALALDARAADGEAGVAWHVGSADAALQAARLALPGTQPVVTTSFAEALAATGGPAWLLPLLALPSVAPAAAPAAAGGGSHAAGVPLPAGGAGLPPPEYAAALSLVAASLEDGENRELFAACQGLRTLAALLAASPPAHRTQALLDAARCVVAALAPCPDMHGEAACRLLFDLRLWAAAPPLVASAHLCALSEWLPRCGGGAGGVAQQPQLAGRHLLRALGMHTSRADPAHLALLQQLLACDGAATLDVLAFLTARQEAPAAREGQPASAAALPEAAAEDALDALLAVCERQLGAPGGCAPPGPAAAALALHGGCGEASALALLSPGAGTSDALRAGAVRLAQLSLVACATAEGAGGTSGSSLGADGGGADHPGEQPPPGAASAASAQASSACESLCAAARPEQAAALCGALAGGPASARGLTTRTWDALCPLLLEGCAGAPARSEPPMAQQPPPARRPSVNAGSLSGSPRSDFLLEDRVTASAFLAQRPGTAPGASSADRVGRPAAPEAFAAGYVPPRGGGCASRAAAAPPPRRLPPGHAARLAQPAGAMLVPALHALRGAAASVRLDACRDVHALLLAASPQAAVASRQVLYSQPGWAEALLSLAMWPPGEEWEQSREQQRGGALAAQPPAQPTTTAVSLSHSAPSGDAAGVDLSGPTPAEAASAGAVHAASEPPPPPPPPPPSPPSLAAGPLCAAAAALWRDRVLPRAPPSPCSEAEAASALRDAGTDALLAALRAPAATPARRAALVAALMGAFQDAAPLVAHELCVECVAATAASAMCRDAGAPNASVAGSWASPLERLRAAAEAAGEAAQATRGQRRDTARLLLLRVAAHARAMLEGGWSSVASAVDGDLDDPRDWLDGEERATDQQHAHVAPSRSALSAAQESNVRRNLLVLGCLCSDELDGELSTSVAVGSGESSSATLEVLLGAAARYAWRASAPPLPRGAGGAAAPPWLEDERAATCGGAGCAAAVPPGKRHHCRLCGAVFCGECSAGRALLPEAPLLQRGGGPHRVCSACFDAVAPLQGPLKSGTLMPGALRAAPAYAALRSLVADVAERCTGGAGAGGPATQPAVVAVAAWLQRAAMLPAEAEQEHGDPQVDAGGGGGGASWAGAGEAAPADGATTSLVMLPQAFSDDAPPGPYSMESEPGDARLSRQQLLRWTLLRLFAVLSEALGARDAAAGAGDASLAARIHAGVAPLAALTARVARATDPLDEGVDEDAPHTTASDGAHHDGAPGGCGVPISVAFQRAFALVGRCDPTVLESAASLAASDASRLLGGAAFGPVRSNAWAAAARVARVVRYARARRLLLDACSVQQLSDAARARTAAEGRAACALAFAAMQRAAAAGAEEESAALCGQEAGLCAGVQSEARAAVASHAHAMRFLRRLGCSAGPWALRRSEQPEGRAFWRLDGREDPQRMRRLLKRDARGSAHAAAAHGAAAAAAAAAALGSATGVGDSGAPGAPSLHQMRHVRARSSVPANAPLEEEEDDFDFEMEAAAASDEAGEEGEDALGSLGSRGSPAARGLLSPLPSLEEGFAGRTPLSALVMRTPSLLAAGGRRSSGVGAHTPSDEPSPGDEPPVVIIRQLSLEPRPYPTPAPSKHAPRLGSDAAGASLVDGSTLAYDVDEDGVQVEWVGEEGTDDGGETEADEEPLAGGEAEADSALAGDASAPPSAAKKRRGLLRRFRAGAKTFAEGVGSNLMATGGAVAGATARVRAATGEAITAIRDDVTAAADAAARVATNTLAMGGLQTLIRAGSGLASLGGGGGAGSSPGQVGPPSFSAPAEFIRATRVAPGTVYVTRTAVEWLPSLHSKPHAPTDRSPPRGDDATEQPAVEEAQWERPRRWPLDAVVAIYPRRFLLRRRALELFLANGKAVLLHLPESEGDAGGACSADSLHRAILAERPPRLVTSPLFAQPLAPRRLLRRARWTARWVAGELSNYEYLMLLNTAAGRTFNDLQQYPVFPWVLADYESSELDLDSAASYRDLSKPVGALNPARLAAFVERFQSMDDPNVPPFHYGTHYSSLGTVLFFLLRLAPYTTAALTLQEGRLDVADRLFASVGEAWRNASTASADVKELTPEFFSTPDFLRNAAGLPLGTRQDGTRVDDVALPPWAHGSPEAFVRLHRAALESDFVSSNLHHWIDLIFGYKQRGAAAEAAHNLFYFLTYEGSVDIDAIQDPVERAAVEAQISLFGQCPSQLFTQPHPQRMAGAARRGAAPPPPPQPPSPGVRPAPLQRLLAPDGGASVAAMWFHTLDPTGCSLLDADGCVRALRWGGVRDSASASSVADGGGASADGGAATAGSSGAVGDAGSGIRAEIVVEERGKRTGRDRAVTPGAGAWARAAEAVTPACMRAALLPGTGGTLLAAGHWGGYAWLLSPEEVTPLQAVLHPPPGVPLCCSVSEDGAVACTGGSDGTLALWRVGTPAASSTSFFRLEGNRGALAGDSRARRLGRRDRAQWLLDAHDRQGQPLARCVGHASAVTACAVSASLGVVLSGAMDGACLLHALHDGRCIRALRVPPSAHDVDGADALRPPGDPDEQADDQDEPRCGAVAAVAIGPEGELVIHALPDPSAQGQGRHLLCVYSLNGRPLAALQLRAPLLSMGVSACGRWLVTASEEAATVLALHTLEPFAELAAPRDGGAICCAALSPCGRALLVGTQGGALYGCVLDAVLGTQGD